MSEEIKSPGNCPLCGGKIEELEKLYKCSENKDSYNEESKEYEKDGCQYKIFKSCFGRFGKEDFSGKEVSTLLENGEVKVTLISGKSGKEYEAMAKTNEKWGVQIDFDALNKDK